jgi:hypothetical protein
MPNPTIRAQEEPSDLSIRLLALSLSSDCENRGVSPRNYAHRARVIRQQTELLNRRNRSRDAATNAAHDVLDNEGACVRSN